MRSRKSTLRAVDRMVIDMLENQKSPESAFNDWVNDNGVHIKKQDAASILNTLVFISEENKREMIKEMMYN